MVIIFDIGGTLIDDPFEEVIQAFKDNPRSDWNHLGLLEEDIMLFLRLWREENYRFDFSFASHFLQEEIWLTRALSHLHSTRGVEIHAEIPLLVPAILKQYRELARKHIAAQPQLPMLMKTLVWLRGQATKVVAASNDREASTAAMLRWAGLEAYFDHVYTSEGLSEVLPHAEKPNPEFFRAVLSKLGLSSAKSGPTAYIGDTESRDIQPAHALGFVTARFLNPRIPTQAAWIDAPHQTVADYTYSTFDELPTVLRSVLTHDRPGAR